MSYILVHELAHVKSDLRGFKSRLAASEADFSAPEVVYFLFKTRLTVVLAQPANSAFLLPKL